MLDAILAGFIHSITEQRICLGFAIREKRVQRH